MSFTHGRTGKIYYSVREKINYYKSVLSGKAKNVPVATKRKAKIRLKTLNKINSQSYDEPRIIVTNDSHFGNGISKPRMAVAYGEDQKGRIHVFPVVKRETKIIVFDKNINRQACINKKGSGRFIDKSDVYEQKYLSNNFHLTKNDIVKIKAMY